MQAALRFGRDPEIDETVVVAHTAALREGLRSSRRVTW
jgi:hypothetical protein